MWLKNVYFIGNVDIYKLSVFHIKMWNRQILDMFLSRFQSFPSKDKVATTVQWEKYVYFFRHNSLSSCDRHWSMLMIS